MDQYGAGFWWHIEDRSRTGFDQARVWFERGLGQCQDSFGLSLIWLENFGQVRPDPFGSVFTLVRTKSIGSCLGQLWNRLGQVNNNFLRICIPFIQRFLKSQNMNWFVNHSDFSKYINQLIIRNWTQLHLLGFKYFFKHGLESQSKNSDQSVPGIQGLDLWSESDGAN